MAVQEGWSRLVECHCAARQEMWRNVRAAAPWEGCGIVTLRSWRVFHIPNVAKEPATTYEGHEGSLLNAVARCGGESFAVYHSHVGTPPEPSRRDKDQAHYPDQFILSLLTGEMARYAVFNGEWTLKDKIANMEGSML